MVTSSFAVSNVVASLMVVVVVEPSLVVVVAVEENLDEEIEAHKWSEMQDILLVVEEDILMVVGVDRHLVGAGKKRLAVVEENLVVDKVVENHLVVVVVEDNLDNLDWGLVEATIECIMKMRLDKAQNKRMKSYDFTSNLYLFDKKK